FQPKQISSMIEYRQFFGEPQKETGITVNIDSNNNITGKVIQPSKYLMSYSLEMFFANGGSTCYIVSVGDYETGGVQFQNLKDGLDKTDEVNEVTLLVFPDSTGLDTPVDYYALHKEAIDKCVLLKDRFVVMDVWLSPDPDADNITILRNSNLGNSTDDLKYAAVYYPRIYTILDYFYKNDDAVVKVTGGAADTLEALKAVNNAQYFQARSAINNIEMVMPVSAAVVGKYAQVDGTRGVWKAPANVTIDYAIRPEKMITDKQQERLNVDVNAGKSINVIRSFPGRGSALIWGARTLAGNSNEWRYIPVRRYFNMVEESTKNATQAFVFEPNDLNTWSLVKSMISNFLIQQWKSGALQGVTPQEAFFVHVGLKETMTYQDILEGRMIVEIGLAVVRPAEFIILRFMHKMLEEA
ncbi:MAG TPA: phage tail sheath C-terminal domain-containing protein, partial [Chitinophagaceae bacterium]|nr:phage tail sheath C-terminal domain-containing protein [Chitinophagaceae bacterium]